MQERDYAKSFDSSSSDFKVDREDHFWRPSFLHIMCFPRVQSLNFVKKSHVTDV